MTRRFALTHLPSPRMAACLRSNASGPAIDLSLAGRQHAAYRRALESGGVSVSVLDINRDFPDAVFIEDTAVVLDEVAILCSMGHSARRGEPAGVEPELRRWREIARIELPATIDGGDVLCVGRRLFVGISGRTNVAGAEALAAIARGHGYVTQPVSVSGCLHLKSACAPLPDGRVLANTDWLDPGALRPCGLIPVPAGEPHAANVARAGEAVCAAADCPETLAMLQGLGYRVLPVDLSEFAKADGGATCLSLIWGED